MFDYNNDNEEGEMICENCGESREYYGSFMECIEDAKKDGWEFEKDEELNVWVHTCEDCV